MTIVTTQHQDQQHGMTVSSFTSVSLDPPLVLVSLQDSTRTCQLVKASGVFGVTVLEESQQDLSDRFAGRTGDENNRFAGLELLRLVTGVPFIPEGLAYFDCRVVTAHPAGDHTLMIGEVLAAQRGRSGLPLIYYDRDYRQLG